MSSVCVPLLVAAKVQIVGLGGDTKIRETVPDFNLVLGYRDITTADIELLTRELNLKETTSTTLDALVTSFGQTGWFKAFSEMKTDSAD